MEDQVKPRVLAVIALDEEFQIFSEKFPLAQDLSTDTQLLLENASGSDDIRLFSVLSNKMGAKSSAHAVEMAVKKIQPHVVLVVGIAGGISGDVKIGDVCVSNEIIDVLHNNKMNAVGERDQIRFSPDFYMADAEYISVFRFLKVHPGLRSIYDGWKSSTIDNEKQLGFIEKEIPSDMHVGPIVCGPVSASTEFNDRLANINRKVIAIETESGGVFGWCDQAKIPVIAIRGISDMADSHKNRVERDSSGRYRKLAMQNVLSLLECQFRNSKFLEFLKKKCSSSVIPPSDFDAVNEIVPRLDREIKERLREVCSSFSSKADSFYFPLPRVQRAIADNGPTDDGMNQPSNVLEALYSSKNVFIRIPRSFSGINLGIYLSHYLIRNQVDDKQILPILIDGKAIAPPRKGLNGLSSDYLRDDKVDNQLFEKVYIVEEPEFSSRTKMEFLKAQMTGSENRVIILSKVEDRAGTIEAFLKDTSALEYTTKRISFAETAIFLEKTFDMTASRAESIAMRLENTFRKFRIEVDPSYFTLIQEDTLTALINANKRAELIQFAVAGLLSLIVAYDPTSLKLSRTTLERFLAKICKYKIEKKVNHIKDTDLAIISSDFLQEYGYDIDQSEFVSPFFKSGLLHNLGGNVYFSHPYLESYLIASALRENPSLAQDYFNPELDDFDIYSFDLYCEMGPHQDVIKRICEYAQFYTALSIDTYEDRDIFSHRKSELNAILNALNLPKISKSVSQLADKLQEVDSTKNVRAEKQRILDTQNHVISGLNRRRKDDDNTLDQSVKDEFYILDGLSRSAVITLTMIGSGSESITKTDKETIIDACLDCNEKFVNIWTLNRMKVDFKRFKDEMLSPDGIMKFMEQSDVDEEMFSKIKKEIEVFISYFQTHLIMEPLARVINNICSIAGVVVLSPIIESRADVVGLQKILRAVWLMEANPRKGNELLKEVFRKYNGATVVRLVVSQTLLNRLFWLHYQTPDSHYFSGIAKRIIGPTGLGFETKTIENAIKGATPE